MKNTPAHEHDFVRAPNKTMFTLAVPVLFSLVAEPVTGLVDTAFVARLGVEATAALGIGTMLFSSIFWVFNFLGIGTQTEVARLNGAGKHKRAAGINVLAMLLGGGIGLVLMIATVPILVPATSLLGGSDAVIPLAEQYMLSRLVGAPAVLVCLACFGTLRGCQDMRSPLIVAVGMNLLNIALDYALIFGSGPLPAMGVAGAGLASSLAQWVGALWSVAIVWRRIGFSAQISFTDLRKLLQIGRDLFLRTGAVLLFLALCTRVANANGAEAGAAYQAGRQIFIFAALFMDAFALSAQSLVGYFLGKADIIQARRVAWYACGWSVATGVALSVFLLAGGLAIADLLVPAQAHVVFLSAWSLFACLMPVFSLAGATDGVHWGTGDFQYLRNVMLTASILCGILVLAFGGQERILAIIWTSTGLWAALRAFFGIQRIRAGGNGPLQKEQV